MNKEKQRIKIAEACGYGGSYTPLWNSLGKPNCHLPDYLNDLNAMHEAEKTMNDHTYGEYSVKLNTIACNIQCGNKSSCGYTISATAAQRAEAFLKTLGLWEDEE